MSDKEKVMKRLSEHLEAVKGKHPEWVGIFLQGSQNYNLDYEGSDVDSKLIVLPSFEDFVLNKSPYSYTHIMENDEHVDVKDICLMLDCFKKQNVNFVEILFTPYRILNPKYEALFQPILDIAERVGRYNNYTYFTLTFNKCHTPKKRVEICSAVLALMVKRFMDCDALDVAVQFTVAWNNDKLESDAKTIAEKLDGKRMTYKGFDGRIVQRDGKVYFMKKYAKNIGYLIPTVDLVRFAKKDGGLK